MTSPDRHTFPEHDDPYWTADVGIGQGDFWRRSHAIRLKAHLTAEQYRNPQEIVPDLALTGMRLYIHAKPYVLVPDVTMTVGLYPEPDLSGAAGEVLDTTRAGMRQVEVGHAQAWAYPADHTLVLWECLLHESRTYAAHPQDDPTLVTLWRGFEAFLLNRLPGMARIVTPAWDPAFDRSVWHEFLRSLGYEEMSAGAFGKDVASPPAT